MFEVFATLSIIDYLRILVEIAVLTFVIYRFYLAISDTKATEVLGMLFALVVIYLLCSALKLDALTSIMNIVAVPFMMLLCVFYHPELRRAFSSSFSRKSRLFRGQQTTGDQIDSILNACNILVEKKRGALIVFPRHTDIQSILDSGTKLNADLSSTLILTIFDHDTPLHDGACVVQGGRITYAACYLPLSEQRNIKATFGTRHRASLGLAEESDAVILVVSEETGAISLSYNANIYYDLSSETIKKTLLKLLSYRDVLPEERQKQEAGEGENA
ncbi:MAG: TIGR00159 family protein [Spirochaetes bacterium]|uniref:Diadenylate cyclase n=1 Tax=Candidatus Ornithospirochaeta stercoripullorum TaxID=2840899 RepID=A0A9D9E0N4_9SPIO|nr:TIGR00159 family protein [Candidatus Ornithospirochaeta stercoripullorum]